MGIMWEGDIGGEGVVDQEYDSQNLLDYCIDPTAGVKCVLL